MVRPSRRPTKAEEAELIKLVHCSRFRHKYNRYELENVHVKYHMAKIRNERNRFYYSLIKRGKLTSRAHVRQWIRRREEEIESLVELWTGIAGPVFQPRMASTPVSNNETIDTGEANPGLESEITTSLEEAHSSSSSQDPKKAMVAEGVQRLRGWRPKTKNDDINRKIHEKRDAFATAFRKEVMRSSFGINNTDIDSAIRKIASEAYGARNLPGEDDPVWAFFSRGLLGILLKGIARKLQ